MKHIDEHRMRLAYIILFVVSLALIAASVWDVKYNDQRLMTWLAGALGGLLVISITFFVMTELILKESLDLRPFKQPVAVSADGSMVAAAGPSPSIWGGSEAPRASAAPATSLVQMERSAWSPNDGSQARAPDVAAVLVEPTSAVIETPQPRAERQIPGPAVIPAASTVFDKDAITYEVGEPNFRLARGAPSQGNKFAVLDNARILCRACGLFFRVDLERSRPLSVQCPKCQKDLGLSGGSQKAEPVRVRCRHCGDFQNLPKNQDVKDNQCPTCGQLNG